MDRHCPLTQTHGLGIMAPPLFTCERVAIMNELKPRLLMPRIIKRCEATEKKIRDEKIRGFENLAREVLTALGELGHEMECSVCAEKSEFENADSGKFLFDMSWTKNDSPGKKDDGKGGRDAETKMQELVLACEDEWGKDCAQGPSRPELILESFQKLVVARASVRLLVYDAPNNPVGDGTWDTYSITEELKEHIQTFQPKALGDTYFLIALNGDLSVRDPNIRPWWLEYAVIVVDDEGKANIYEEGKINSDRT